MKLKRTLLTVTVAGLVVIQNSRAEDASDEINALKQQIQALDQKVRVLERNHELEGEAAEAKAKDAPKIILGSNGMTISSAETNFSFSLRALLQVDTRTFFDDGGIQGNDAFILRRARPIFQGTVYHDFDFLFTPDFAGSSVQIVDAYLNYKYQPWLQLRMGKYKVPIGLEQLQSDPVTFFNERALPTSLVPNRDIGFQLWGDVAGSRLSYALGVFNGLGDGRTSSNTDFEDHRELAGRIFLQPFKKSDTRALQGIGFGVGGSWGKMSPNAAGLTSGYLTDGQQQFFVYTNTAVADGVHWRLSPQAYYYLGPVGLLAEYVISNQEVSQGANHADLQHAAWQVGAGWVLTGEDASYTGLTPKRPFDLSAGHWGAFQIVARYAELDIDNDAFPLYANPGAGATATTPGFSASGAQAWAVGLNWFLNKNLRVNTSYARTTFTGNSGAGTVAPAAVTRQPEQVFFTRVQMAF